MSELYLLGTGMVDVPPKHGGAVESYLCDLAAMFPEAKVIADGELPQCIPVHSPFDRFPFPSRTAGLAHLIGGSLTAFAALRHVERESTVHINEEVCGMLLARYPLPAKRRIVTIHNPPPFLGGDPRDANLRSMDWRLSVSAAKGADRVVALSRRMAAALVMAGIPPERIRVVPLPVNTDRFEPIPEMAGIGSDALFVGRLEARKNPVLLAGAVHGMHLTFVGAGSLFWDVVVAGRQAGNEVAMMPTPSPRALVGQYQTAKMLVLPSRLEVYPRVVVEAAACGMPVILPDIPLYEEFIAAGFVQTYPDDREMGDVIATLREDPDRRAKMGRAGRDFALRTVSYNAVRRKMLEVYLGN